MKKVLNIFIVTLLCFYSSCTNPDTDCAKEITDCAINKMLNDAELFEDCLGSTLTQYLNIDSLPNKRVFREEIGKDDAMSEKLSKLAIALRIESRNLNAPELSSKELDEVEEVLEGLAEFFDKLSKN